MKRLMICLMVSAFIVALSGLSTAKETVLPIAKTRYVKEQNIIMRGTNKGVSGWGVICSRRDGLLPTTTRATPEQAVIEFRILVQNNGNVPTNISPSGLTLVLTNGTALDVFKGEDWGDGFVWLSPKLIELNGKDISMENRSSVLLKPAEFVVLAVSFPMEKQFRESEAISLCSKVLLPVISKEKIVVPLLFSNITPSESIGVRP